MVKDAAQSDAGTDLTLGLSVFVRWGLDLVPGVIVDRYDTGSVGRVVVRLDPQNTDEDEPPTVTVPTTEVYPATDVGEVDPPGSWVHSVSYERDVQRALSRVLSQLKRAGSLERSVSAGDRAHDLVVDLGDAQLILEVKYRRDGVFAEEHADQVARQLERAPGTTKLVVSNARFPGASVRRLSEDRIVPITWRAKEDDPRLAEALAEAVTAQRTPRTKSVKPASKKRSTEQQALEPSVAGGTRKAGRTTTRRRVAQPSDRAQNKAIREWARSKKKKISDRGRIPEDIAAEYYTNVGR